MKAHELETTEERSLTDPTVKQRSGGGTLTAFEPNEIQDGSTYTLPAADSVDAGGWVLVELPDKYSASNPTIQRAGSDTISYSGGSDTSVVFDTGLASIRFTSDGISVWSI